MLTTDVFQTWVYQLEKFAKMLTSHDSDSNLIAGFSNGHYKSLYVFQDQTALNIKSFLGNFCFTEGFYLSYGKTPLQDWWNTFQIKELENTYMWANLVGRQR